MDVQAYLLSFPVDFKIARSRILYSHHVVVTLAAGGFGAAGSGVLYRSTGWQVGQLWSEQLRSGLAGLALDEVRRGEWQESLERIVAAEPGLAFAADQNGYPGPLHILELNGVLGRVSASESAAAGCRATGPGGDRHCASPCLPG